MKPYVQSEDASTPSRDAIVTDQVAKSQKNMGLGIASGHSFKSLSIVAHSHTLVPCQRAAESPLSFYV